MDITNQSGITIYLKANVKNIPEHEMKRLLIKDKSEAELLKFIEVNLAKRESSYNPAKIIFETEHLTSRENVSEYIDKLEVIITL